MELNVISTKLIKPSSPTPPHLKNYKLSFFDQLAEREHVPLLLFYPRGHDDESATIDEKLEQSLSRILTHVYPAAGRLSKDRCSIDCLDQGVTFAKARVQLSIQRFHQSGDQDLEDADFDTTPPVVAQVTGSNVVVLYIHQFIAPRDGWQEICQYFPASCLSRRFEAKFIGKIFIDEVTISGLRDKLAGAMDSGKISFKPSRVEIITALLWRALIRVSEAKHGYLRPSLVFFPVQLMTCPAAVVNSYKEMFLSKEWSNDNDEVDKCTISSLCKFPMQEADFGWGKPSLMHFGLRDYHSCWMYDAECGSICVQVDLKDTYMRLFEQDSDIRTFTKFY
ncbi:hypothetical protein HAX54_016790 [Datura stramonium]|uniref:Uncharacterized protein n=1 Tax=Datura stramonium TaxID=4076 RepID=A0ABS8UMG0_DATST|nr:hypothetical protein [Datura stramonium]